LSGVFSIDICAYAVLSNHYHLVLHVDRTRAAEWSKQQVVDQWSTLFRVPTIVERWRKAVAGQAERDAAERLIEAWRHRLTDVSWYMRCLNEPLARRANAEDACTGRFWEGRFKSQALLDEAGLLTAMAYVDLNPLRAGIAATPEDSEFTSIHERIRQHRLTVCAQRELTGESSAPLVPLLAFQDHAAPDNAVVPFRFIDYLELLDWSGRCMRPDKYAAIDPRAPPILTRLNINATAWQASMHLNSNVFGRAMGQLDHLRLHAKALGQSWVKGLRQAQTLYRQT
jgi:hypothetical protein